jgi:hypothetical protein
VDETTTRAQRGYFSRSVLTTTWTDHEGRQHRHETFNAHEQAELRKRLRAEGLEAYCGARTPGYQPPPGQGALAALKRVAQAGR